MAKLRIVGFVLLALICSNSQSFAQTFVSGVVPYYYEFDAIENPKSNFWCGHAALKAVGVYITGKQKTLGALHDTFRLNSPGGYAKDNNCLSTSVHWCAKLQDLEWAATKSQYGGYGRSNSVRRDINRGTATNPNYSGFYAQIKAGVNANYPAIIASRWYYSDAGHFFIVTGYKDGADVKSSYLYLRDVAAPPVYGPIARYDKTVTVKNFFDKTVNGNNLIQILYMK